MSQSFPQTQVRWLSVGLAAWTACLLAAQWVRTRAASRVAISPVSADWLQDFERQSIRSRDL